MPRIPGLSDDLQNFNPSPFVTSSTTTVKMRQRIEIDIAHAFIFTALDKGYTLHIDNGAESTKKFNNTIDALSAMFKTDEDMIYLWKDGKRAGWVHFVYGNDGWDVISDHSTKISDLIDKGDVHTLINYYGS